MPNSASDYNVLKEMVRVPKGLRDYWEWNRLTTCLSSIFEPSVPGWRACAIQWLETNLDLCMVGATFSKMYLALIKLMGLK